MKLGSEKSVISSVLNDRAFPKLYSRQQEFKDAVTCFKTVKKEFYVEHIPHQFGTFVMLFRRENI